MATFTGVVESVARTGKAFKIGGEWYSAFTAGQLNGANVGDNVRFVYNDTTKEGTTYHNIKGSVSILPPAAAPATHSEGLPVPPRVASAGYSPKGGRSFPVGPLDPERSIIRQNSLTQANFLFKTLGAHTSFFINVSDLGANVRTVIELARLFEAYSAGDMDALEAEEAIAAMSSAMGAKEF